MVNNCFFTYWFTALIQYNSSVYKRSWRFALSHKKNTLTRNQHHNILMATWQCWFNTTKLLIQWNCLLHSDQCCSIRDEATGLIFLLDITSTQRMPFGIPKYQVPLSTYNAQNYGLIFVLLCVHFSFCW